ncbi:MULTISPECIES: hypothetical protein [unclassified Streptomyces]|uniref:hypothetical protein n=1 Tax=unclassified Streptomyces TaxID=2593676 RepID=UPI0035E1A56A
MAELAGYARFRDAMERAHPTFSDSAPHAFSDSAPHERESAAAATAVTSSSSG